jgi:hypothetical protein
MMLKKHKTAIWYKRTNELKTFISKGLVKRIRKVKIWTIKGLLITSICLTSIIAPITLPIFVVVSLCTGLTSYLMLPFIILDLKTIIIFIIES